jgi:CBS domain containing-hemolysin-like protein
MTALIIYFCAAIGVSAICSLSESGLLSLSRTEAERLKRGGRWSGKALYKMNRDVDRPLAAILTVNTVANCFGAAGVGSEAENIWGNDGMATASAILTLCILVFAEIIPKTLGARYAARLADVIAVAIRIMTMITYPITIVLRNVSALFGEAPPVRTSREDIRLAAQLGLADGAIQHDEARIIGNVLEFVHQPVNAVMTPIDAVRSYRRSLTIGELLDRHAPLPHSRLPVYEDGYDQIEGYVLRNQMYELARSGQLGRLLGEVAKPLHEVSSSASIRDAADELKKHTTKILRVRNQQGQTTGILTNQDLIWKLIGVRRLEDDS